jgi:poly(3-hydroxybutyrate) depolymerase
MARYPDTAPTRTAQTTDRTGRWRGARAVALARTLVLIAGLAGQATVAAESGCGAPPPASGTYKIEHNGRERTYGLLVPTGYDRTRPQRLVLAFHGWGGDEQEFLGDPDVVRESEHRGYVLVAPRGLGSGEPDRRKNSWTFEGSASGRVGRGARAAAVCDVALTPDYTYPSCREGTAANTCSWTQCQDDDVAFVGALLREVETRLCVDPKHVYATGGSNGGMFVWELARSPAIAPQLRAIAPIIGLPHRGDLRPPAGSAALPTLLVTGLADPTVPPGAWDDPAPTTTRDDDRFFYTGATAIVRRFSHAAGCPVTGRERPFATGQAVADCRRYCEADGRHWPAVLDCRAPMAHDYGFAWSWKLVLDFFDQW